MVWDVHVLFTESLNYFFLYFFFHIFNFLDFFCIVVRGSEFIVGTSTLWAQLLLQF